MTNLNKVNLNKPIQMVDLSKPVRLYLKPYRRTPEDDLHDLREREWKDEINRQACREFLRRNPSGRINFN